MDIRFTPEEIARAHEIVKQAMQGPAALMAGNRGMNAMRQGGQQLMVPARQMGRQAGIGNPNSMWGSMAASPTTGLANWATKNFPRATSAITMPGYTAKRMWNSPMTLGR